MTASVRARLRPTVWAGAVLLLGCGGSGDNAPDPSVNRQDPRSVAIIDPATVQPGDTVAGLIVRAADLQPSLADPSQWVGDVAFEGAMTVSGQPRLHPAYPEVDQLCFFADDGSADHLPRLPFDERTSWFCFVNQEEAREELDDRFGSDGVAITVNQFHYRYEHTDVFNTARLLGLPGGAP